MNIEMDSMINVGEAMGHEDVVNNTTRRILRKDVIRLLAMPSVATMIAVLLLTNTILLLKKKEETAFTGKETIRSAYRTSDSNKWSARNSSLPCSDENEVALSENVYITSCIKERGNIIEIQHRNNKNVTIGGIQLNQMQWWNMKKTCGIY
jgi:hypothetical protein